MQRNTRKTFVAAVATAALAGSGFVLAAPAMAKTAALPTGGAPTLRTAITDNGGLYVDGPTSFPAGRLRISLDNARSGGGSVDVEVVRLARGYSWKDYRTDLKTAFTNLFAPNGDKKAGLKALNHAIDNATLYGGLDVNHGKLRRGMLLLDQASNRYFVYNDSGGLPRQQTRLSVGAPVGPQTLVKAAATVTAKTDRRFGGASALPSNGLVEFKNKSTESPHMLILQHVKDGTTRRQVVNAFTGSGNFSFGLAGEQGSDVVGEGHADVIHVHLRPGTYAELCFMPDPITGAPHVVMGMVRIVSLV
jgi:hypothetical protein